MIPKLNRGFGFLKLTTYLTHDKRDEGAEAGDPHPDTALRVGFTRTMNFHGDAARDDPATAARIMALTWQSREELKRAAGIKPGGSQADAPPVWHTSLSWAKSERPTEAQMMQAVESYLKHQGLGLDKGYQTYVVQHTDTEHPHVHVVVNLVHPEHGRQANPYRDKQKAQAWGRAYEKQNGQVFCVDREAKYAALDVARALQLHAGQARPAFNQSARGNTARAAPAPAAQPDGFGRSRDRDRDRQSRSGQGQGENRRPRKSQTRPEWQARQRTGHDNQAGQDAADRLKAEIAAKYAALRSGQAEAFAQRTAESARFRADRRDGRDAIYEKYRTAFDGVWKPQPGPKQASPDRSHLFESVQRQQAEAKAAFDANERTAMGRIRNAVALAGGGSVFKAARLAVNAKERQRLFERGQRAIVASNIPHEPRQQARPAPTISEPKRVQAERLKTMRTAELAAHDRDTATKAASLKGRHQFQITAGKDARAMLAKETKAAWRQHEAMFGVQKPERQKAEARSQTTDLQEQARKPDRFGRSRERQPRTPRAQRGERAGSAAVAAIPAPILAKAENSRVERGYLTGQFPAPEPQTPHQAQPEAAQERNSGQGSPEQPQQHDPAPANDGRQAEATPRTSWTPEEREAAIRAARERREESDRIHDHDPGRTR